MKNDLCVFLAVKLTSKQFLDEGGKGQWFRTYRYFKIFEIHLSRLEDLSVFGAVSYYLKEYNNVVSY